MDLHVILTYTDEHGTSVDVMKTFALDVPFHLDRLQMGTDAHVLLDLPISVDGDHYVRLSPERIQSLDDAMCLNCRQLIVACDASGCHGRKAVGWRTEARDDDDN